eukprot:scaffold12692_cov67-Phaeocystis_antarctica.AAC.1
MARRAWLVACAWHCSQAQVRSYRRRRRSGGSMWRRWRSRRRNRLVWPSLALPTGPPTLPPGGTAVHGGGAWLACLGKLWVALGGEAGATPSRRQSSAACTQPRRNYSHVLTSLLASAPRRVDWTHPPPGGSPYCSRGP